MKSLSVILVFIGLTVLGMLIAGCFGKRLSARKSKEVLFCIEIGHKDTDTYVPLIDASANGKTKLHEKLNNAKHNGGQVQIMYLDCPEPQCTPVPITLKTDRVIKSELASNRGRDSSAANDPNLMNRVSSQDPKDIAEIAALLNP